MLSFIKPQPYDYTLTRRMVYSLVDKYPFLRYENIGKSVMGKEIMSLSMGKHSQYVLMTAAFHGNEWITAPLLLHFMEKLCCAYVANGNVSDISARRAFCDRGLIIVPMVNPDGCDICISGEKACGENAAKFSEWCSGDFSKWTANGRGVDINHNFPAGWEELHRKEQSSGISSPTYSRYGGARPLSEPESTALADLCHAKNVTHVLALHSQGEEIYWSYGDKTPQKAFRMANIMSVSSGYKLSEPTGLAVGGGFKDWFIDAYSRPGFTVEVGKGKNPLPITDLPEIYTRTEEMLMLTLIM